MVTQVQKQRVFPQAVKSGASSAWLGHIHSGTALELNTSSLTIIFHNLLIPLPIKEESRTVWSGFLPIALPVARAVSLSSGKLLKIRRPFYPSGSSQLAKG